MLAQVVLMTSETTDKGVAMENDKIRLTTIHQSKGLEYPIVFVIGLADEQFPLKRAIEEGDVEEERRLFYVSVTRAMDELYMIYPMMQLKGGIPERKNPSRFLQDLPTHTYENLRIRR